MCSLKKKKSPKVWREGILLKRKTGKKTQLTQNTSQVLLYLVFQPNYLVDVVGGVKLQHQPLPRMPPPPDLDEQARFRHQSLISGEEV
jgi:hypothetical protein